MTNKKYYWIKLKTDFFNREDIDFMLSQENGCEYVVLYQMLCLNTANSDGKLETRMNEVIIPYDIKKIVRDCKYFDCDTVAVALDLYKKLGLIYEEENKILKIANYNEMIGSETKYAQIKRNQRENNVPLVECKRLNKEMLRLPNGNTVFVDEKRYGGNGMLAYDLAGGKCEICGSEENLCIHHNNGYSNEIEDLYILCRKCHSNVENNKGVEIVHHYVHQENRDKSIENRDKIIDNNIKRFKKPTIEEIEEYCKERNNGINANAFYDFYESKDWYVGKNKMKDWKACIRTWEQRNNKKQIEEPVPEWFDKELTNDPMSEEDKQEVDNMLEDIEKMMEDL